MTIAEPSPCPECGGPLVPGLSGEGLSQKHALDCPAYVAFYAGEDDQPPSGNQESNGGLTGHLD